MKILLAPLMGALFAASVASSPAAAAPRPEGQAVVINAHPIDAATLATWRERWRRAVPPGRYWYDHATGAWGREGGPTVGWLAPDLPLPGPMHADASGGGRGRLSGVFINGRELHPLDVAGLARATGSPPWPGSWWMDAAGNFGALAGTYRGPVLGNVMQMARARAAAVGTRGGPPGGPVWGLTSRDGSQFIGHDGEGHFATGSRGEPYFAR